MEIITGKILKLNNWPDGKVIGIAKRVASSLADQGLQREVILARLNAVRQNPVEFLSDALMADLAQECLHMIQKAENPAVELRQKPLFYPIWGREAIDDESLAQMNNAMRLPVSVAGALMPDAHVGYGLPIGGVLATDNAVIPYAVGVDIACRMRISIYEISPDVLYQTKSLFETALRQQTCFGLGAEWPARQRPDHEVLDDADWSTTRLLKNLQNTALRQLGTSGCGNHFVEWGDFELFEPLMGLKVGLYLALLSHSGSRNVGYKIADYYSKLALEKHPDLDKSVRHLAWLSLDSQEGQEYWLAMELAGRFAAANHAIIHRRVSDAAGLKAAAVVENHHNFAWRQTLADGRVVIVHRKGATPAGKGMLGVIPGSMGDAGYVVRGRGSTDALDSASHGAGRLMSRKAAINTISKTTRDAYLKERGVTLLGGGLDESPQAYKPINQVIAAQQDLVEIIGRFSPRIVRMANEGGVV